MSFWFGLQKMKFNWTMNADKPIGPGIYSTGILKARISFTSILVPDLFF
jgi:hypothetical protein